MTQQNESTDQATGQVWFGAWHGCSGTFLGETYIEVPKQCPTHGGPLMAEPDVVTGLADQVRSGTEHLDYAVDGE
jgi:hypothetical protein